VYSYGGEVLQPQTNVADAFNPAFFGTDFIITPEPASWLLACVGLTGLAAIAGSRRRQSRNAA
jgi:MYXO-CTERM domain-containing protein